ncbi:polysaccharide deacetylase family protein [Geodermatophilus sp. SYSU D00815]
MPTRRDLLVGLGSGAVGAAAGAVTGVVVTDDEDAVRRRAAVRAERQFLETSGAADEFSDVERLGSHRLLWSLTTDQPLVAFTFDDGPTPEFTPRILDALAAAGATATFNIMGYNAVEHPGILRDVVAAGHELGNHTWTHEDLSRLTPAQTREQIVRCAQEVEDIVDAPITSFRPPRGELTGSALKICAEMGYEVRLWSCTRGPGDSSDPRVVARYIGDTPLAGDVLGLHDGIGRGTFNPGAAFTVNLSARRETEVEALPEALARLTERGLQVVSVDRMVAVAT